jgi:hypothetical protein
MKKKSRQFSSTREWTKFIFLLTLLLFFVYPAYGQDWMQTNLSEGKIWIGATSLDSKAYFAGGQVCSNGQNTSKVEIYDATAGTWDVSHNLSVARSGPAVVTCGKKVLFAGGLDLSDWPASTLYSTVDIFDTENGYWTVQHLSLARGAMGVSKGDTAIFAGGIIGVDPFFTGTDVVDIYDAANDIWTTATLSEPRAGFAAVVVGDLAMFAGGYDGQNVTKRIDIYNFSTGMWSIDSLSSARGFLAATAVGNKAYFAGGMTQSNFTSNLVDVYDAETRQWLPKEYLSKSRAFLGSINAATVDNQAYFVNGGKVDLVSGAWLEDYKIIDVYNPIEDSWEQILHPGHRVNHTVVAIENDSLHQLLVAGGGPCNNKVDIYTPPPVNVQSIKHEIDYTIFPNPAADKLNITTSFKNETSGTLVLYNITGHIAYQYEFKGDLLSHEIDLEIYSPGMYMLEIRTENGRVVEKVMIVE